MCALRRYVTYVSASITCCVYAVSLYVYMCMHCGACTGLSAGGFRGLDGLRVFVLGSGLGLGGPIEGFS